MCIPLIQHARKLYNNSRWSWTEIIGTNLQKVTCAFFFFFLSFYFAVPTFSEGVSSRADFWSARLCLTVCRYSSDYTCIYSDCTDHIMHEKPAVTQRQNLSETDKTKASNTTELQVIFNWKKSSNCGRELWNVRWISVNCRIYLSVQYNLNF